MPLNFDLGGKTYDRSTVTVTAEQIADYAAASGDVEARFTDLVIPGSDLTTSVWESDGEGVDFETRRPDGAVVVTGRLGTS